MLFEIEFLLTGKILVEIWDFVVLILAPLVKSLFSLVTWSCSVELTFFTGSSFHHHHHHRHRGATNFRSSSTQVTLRSDHSEGWVATLYSYSFIHAVQSLLGLWGPALIFSLPEKVCAANSWVGRGEIYWKWERKNKMSYRSIHQH